MMSNVVIYFTCSERTFMYRAVTLRQGLLITKESIVITLHHCLLLLKCDPFLDIGHPYKFLLVRALFLPNLKDRYQIRQYTAKRYEYRMQVLLYWE